MTKRIFYTLLFIIASLIAVTSLYYLSRKSECCGDCHIESHTHETAPTATPEQIAPEQEATE